MYSVYILDDEPLVLEDMKKAIPWNEHNLLIIGSNTDPVKAKREILSLKPEVVFTDLIMPNLSGLELIDSLKARGLDSVFVVISAHENFNYARQLIHLEAFDYLIKPVQKKQYEELFSRLQARLEKRFAHDKTPMTNSDELNNILLYLNKNIGKKHTLKEIAKRFNFSSNYICSLFSKHLGITFSSYITKIRMEAAEKLLLNTNKNVKEISSLIGYEDYFYFCRVFRDFFACTPTQLRSRNEEETINPH